MYFLSFLALFRKFKSKKLLLKCFCAVFQCFLFLNSFLVLVFSFQFFVFSF